MTIQKFLTYLFAVLFSCSIMSYSFAAGEHTAGKYTIYITNQSGQTLELNKVLVYAGTFTKLPEKIIAPNQDTEYAVTVSYGSNGMNTTVEYIVPNTSNPIQKCSITAWRQYNGDYGWHKIKAHVKCMKKKGEKLLTVTKSRRSKTYMIINFK